MASETCPECGAQKHQLNACPMCGWSRSGRSIRPQKVHAQGAVKPGVARISRKLRAIAPLRQTAKPEPATAPAAGPSTEPTPREPRVVLINRGESAPAEKHKKQDKKQDKKLYRKLKRKAAKRKGKTPPSTISKIYSSGSRSARSFPCQGGAPGLGKRS